MAGLGWQENAALLPRSVPNESHWLSTSSSALPDGCSTVGLIESPMIVLFYFYFIILLPLTQSTPPFLFPRPLPCHAAGIPRGRSRPQAPLASISGRTFGPSQVWASAPMCSRGCLVLRTYLMVASTSASGTQRSGTHCQAEPCDDSLRWLSTCDYQLNTREFVACQMCAVPLTIAARYTGTEVDGDGLEACPFACSTWPWNSTICTKTALPRKIARPRDPEA